jgi:hypothetical protein
MKIRYHSKNHIVELDIDSRRQIFPGDLDLTLNWKPETEIAAAATEDEISSYVLVGGGAEVRVIAEGESSPVGQVKEDAEGRVGRAPSVQRSAARPASVMRYSISPD